MSEATTEELVQLDRIGTVTQPGADLRATVYAPGLPEASRRRFEEDSRFTLVDEGDEIAGCDVALLSTRSPRGDLLSQLDTFRTNAQGPVVVLAHPGGESSAVELMRQGAVSVLGEGDEQALAAVISGLDGSDGSEGLLEAYDRSTAQLDNDGASRGLDPVTGLLDDLAMRARVEELAHARETPRVAFARLINIPRTPRELSYEGLGAMRRRIARQFLHLCDRFGCDLYAMDESDFGIVGADLSPNDAEHLARSMQELAATFVPTGVRPLSLAFGHAGPEAATDSALLLELAARARDVAAQDAHGGIVSAELLALGMASSTELQATMRLLDHVEQMSHHGVGHGERVAQIAASLAGELGYDGMSKSRIRMAAHFHEIGKARLSKDAVADPATLEGELLASYRTHPILGAEYVEPIAGSEVAELVRSYSERWDGGGIPDGLSGRTIPTGARIIAIAHAVETKVHEAAQSNGASGALSAAAALLQEMAGNELDPDMAEVAATMVSRGVLGQASLALAV
jgi:HD-GYP domain-containing protein (c-di-GMP phosphodiesterase class II)